MEAMEAGVAEVIGAVGPDPLGDIGELYRRLSKPLERIVRVDVHAPDAVVEDACQFAWSRLVHHQQRVHRETAMGWLVKTAVHEALKLVRRAGRELSLDAAVERGVDFRGPLGAGAPSELVEQHDRLASIRSLPPRQQRVLWLYGLGLSYEEIAVHDRCTPRTVERQLQRGRANLRARHLD
jgi:RNA polymerase sigma factor (sigma-70 family)